MHATITLMDGGKLRIPGGRLAHPHRIFLIFQNIKIFICYFMRYSISDALYIFLLQLESEHGQEVQPEI